MHLMYLSRKTSVLLVLASALLSQSCWQRLGRPCTAQQAELSWPSVTQENICRSQELHNIMSSSDTFPIITGEQKLVRHLGEGIRSEIL